jgi:hypothetical protein
MPWGSAEADNSHAHRTAIRSVRARVRLVELGNHESIDLFLREEDARRALEGILSDEPDWAGLFYVAPVELDERDVSAN